MGRQPKKCAKKCAKHHFSLKPVHYSASLSRETVFSYCPQNLKSEANFPRFNRDRKAYTSSFVLACDKAKLIANDQNYKMDHERFKKQNAQEKPSPLMPRPRAKYNYCSVCKDNYQDYQQHIESETHSQNIHSNKYEPLIMEMCKNFAPKQQVTLPYELNHLMTSKISLETCEQSSSARQKSVDFGFEEPHFLFEGIPKNTFPTIGQQGSFKSIPLTSNIEWEPFHNVFCPPKPQNYAELEGRNAGIGEEYLGCKVVSVTASPRRINLKPIILNGTLKL